MAKISEDKLLSEEELEQANGGVEVGTEHHWYGNKYRKCNSCGPSDFDVIGIYSTNVLEVKCKKCGMVQRATLKS